MRSTGDRKCMCTLGMLCHASVVYSCASGTLGMPIFEPIGGSQEAEPEDLEAVNSRHTIQVFIDSADQHLPPETVDGVRRLALLEQPVEHADAVEIFTPRAFAAQGQEGAGDGEFVGAAETLHAEEGLGEMERGGQASAFEHRDPPARFDEIKFAIDGDGASYSEPLVEIQQIDAATQQDVLAVV